MSLKALKTPMFLESCFIFAKKKPNLWYLEEKLILSLQNTAIEVCENCNLGAATVSQQTRFL